MLVASTNGHECAPSVPPPNIHCLLLRNVRFWGSLDLTISFRIFGTNVGYWELGKQCYILITSFGKKNEHILSIKLTRDYLDSDAKTQLQMKLVAAFFEQSQTHTHILWDMNFVKITQRSIQKDKHEQMLVE